MKRINEWIVGIAVLAVVMVITWGIFAVGDNMRPGVTPFSQDVYVLHNTVMGVVTVIGVLLFTTMFTSIILHSRKKNPNPAKFSHSTKAEIISNACEAIDHQAATIERLQQQQRILWAALAALAVCYIM